MSNCAKCVFPQKICHNQNGRGLEDCPTQYNTNEVKIARDIYETEPYRTFSRAAARQEGAGYSRDEKGLAYADKTRLQETIEFCLRMNYKKIGLAFCLGLQKEASVVTRIFEENGLEVVSVVCKVGGINKETFGIEKECYINPGQYEVICNPVWQAEICNAAATDFNVVLGLCVGHDSMFLKHSEAFATVLAAKDRVLAHNPLGAIYNADSYYKRLRNLNQK